MLNKTCVITGCNSGIGHIASLELARQGFELFMLMRDSEKSASAHKEVLEAADGGRVHHIPVDLSLMVEVAAAAKQVLAKAEKIDLLINNAGVLVREEQRTVEGIEMTLAVNYYAPYLLTKALRPLLEKATAARVVNVSSALSKRGKVLTETAFEQKPFSGIKAYSNSKLLVNYFTHSLSESFEGTPMVANSLHPGVVSTGVFRAYPTWITNLLSRFLLTPKQGAQHLLRPAVNPSFNHYKGEIEKKISGVYFNKAKGHELSKILRSSDLKDRIVEKTEEVLRSIEGLGHLLNHSPVTSK